MDWIRVGATTTLVANNSNSTESSIGSELSCKAVDVSPSSAHRSISARAVTFDLLHGLLSWPLLPVDANAYRLALTKCAGCSAPAFDAEEIEEARLANLAIPVRLKNRLAR